MITLAEIAALEEQCRTLIESTHAVIARTNQLVLMIRDRVARQRERIERQAPVLRASRISTNLIEAEVFDGPEAERLLAEVADSCSHCGSRVEPLVAAVRFRPGGVEMILCGECYPSLADLSLGQVV